MLMMRCGKSFLLFLIWTWTVVLSGLKGRAQLQEELARRVAGLATMMMEMTGRMLLYLLD